MTKVSTLGSAKNTFKDIDEMLTPIPKSKLFKLSNGQIITLPGSFSLYKRIVPYKVIRTYNSGKSVRVKSLFDNSHATVNIDGVLLMTSKTAMEAMRFFDGLTNLWEIASKQQLDKEWKKY